MIAAYDTACNSDSQCRAALVALNADASCVNTLVNDNTAAYCSESCADLINAAFDTCPDVSDDIYSCS